MFDTLWQFWEDVSLTKSQSLFEEVHTFLVFLSSYLAHRIQQPISKFILKSWIFTIQNQIAVSEKIKDKDNQIRRVKLVKHSFHCIAQISWKFGVVVSELVLDPVCKMTNRVCDKNWAFGDTISTVVLV